MAEEQSQHRCSTLLCIGYLVYALLLDFVTVGAFASKLAAKPVGLVQHLVYALPGLSEVLVAHIGEVGGCELGGDAGYVVSLAPHVVVAFGGRHVVAHIDIVLAGGLYHVTARYEPIAQDGLQQTRSAQFIPEQQPLGNDGCISCVYHGYGLLGVPVVHLVVEVAAHVVFVLDDRPYLGLGDGKLDAVVVFVDLLGEYHVALHLGLDHLAVLEVYGDCLDAENLLMALGALAVVEHVVYVGIVLAGVLEYLDAEAVGGDFGDVAAVEAKAHIAQVEQHHGCRR